MLKKDLAIYAAGVFDACGAISTSRPIASALQGTKKHEMLSRLHEAFGGDLAESAGQGKGEGKTFVQWSIKDEKERKAFFKAILPHSIATSTIEKHLA